MESIPITTVVDHSTFVFLETQSTTSTVMAIRAQDTFTAPSMKYINTTEILSTEICRIMMLPVLFASLSHVVQC